MTHVPLKSQGATDKQTTQQFSSFNELADITFKREVIPQPAPIVFEGETMCWYKSTRNGQTKSVFLIEVKKDKVLVKDHEGDKHTRNMSLAEFIKFYA